MDTASDWPPTSFTTNSSCFCLGNVYMICSYICMYGCFLAVPFLVIDVQVVMISPENATNATHSITVSCNIYSNSSVDMCVIMAMADGQATITGNH